MKCLRGIINAVKGEIKTPDKTVKFYGIEKVTSDTDKLKVAHANFERKKRGLKEV